VAEECPASVRGAGAKNERERERQNCARRPYWTVNEPMVCGTMQPPLTLSTYTLIALPGENVLPGLVLL